MIVAGGILVAASRAARVTGHPARGHISSLGVTLGVTGLAVGLVTLLIFAVSRGGRSARRKHASHRRRAGPAAAAGRERGGVLNPTTVYSPGGLIDVPRDVRASASEGAARTSGFSGPPAATPPRATRPAGSQGAREAFKAPMAGGPPRSGPGEARPSPGPGRMGAPPPRPGYQAGPRPASGSGWGPPGPAGRPAQQPMPPPPGRVRPGDASPPREGFPPRDAPALGAGPPRGASPFRESPPHPGPPGQSPPPRPGPAPRHGRPVPDARESWRPEAPVPPIEVGHSSRGARPGPNPAVGMAGFEGRHRGLRPPWLAGIRCGAPVTRRRGRARRRTLAGRALAGRALAGRALAGRARARRRALPERRSPAGRACAERRGIVGREPFTRRGRIARSHSAGRWRHGLLGRTTGWAGGSPARARGRARAGLIPGPRRRHPHAACARRRPGLPRAAARWAARHRCRERLASTLRPRWPRSPRRRSTRRAGEPGGLGRSFGG